MPVTSKLTVAEASCVSVSGAAVVVASLDSVLAVVPGSAAGVALSLLGCCVQPIASSIKNAAKCFSFISPPFFKMVNIIANR